VARNSIQSVVLHTPFFFCLAQGESRNGIVSWNTKQDAGALRSRSDAECVRRETYISIPVSRENISDDNQPNVRAIFSA